MFGTLRAVAVAEFNDVSVSQLDLSSCAPQWNCVPTQKRICQRKSSFSYSLVRGDLLVEGTEQVRDRFLCVEVRHPHLNVSYVVAIEHRLDTAGIKAREIDHLE